MKRPSSKLVKVASIAIVTVALTAAVVTALPAIYTYRSETAYGMVRINRLTQEVTVMRDGSWVPLRQWMNHRYENYKAQESKLFFSQEENKEIIFEPTTLWPGPTGRLEFRIYNGTSRPMEKVKVRVLLEPDERNLPGDAWDQLAEARQQAQPIDQPFFQPCFVPSHSWAYTTISLDNIPSQLGDLHRSAELTAAESDENQQ